jgi:dATP/dGTP diphosphohydrolase
VTTGLVPANNLDTSEDPDKGFSRGARGGTDEEVRVTDPHTGGQKGIKPEAYSLVPVWPQAEIARTYGKGAEKYESENWRRGYAWSHSISSLLGHINLWRSGESWDKETGLHHLAHAAFHLNTLMEFERLSLGTDDRGDV